jgi:hypothetical protein
MKRGISRRRAGLTLIELIVAFSILLILSTMALPLMRVRVQREKERRLRQALEEIRTAIDRYKDAADQGLLGQLDQDSHGYPASLDELVEGVEVTAGAGMMGGMQGMGGMPGSDPSMGGSMGGQLGGGMPGGMGGSAFGAGGAGSRQGFGQTSGAGGFGQSRSQGRSSGGLGQSRSGASRSGGLGGDSAFGRRGESGDDGEAKKLRFLRRIPTDPITGRAEWGMRGVSDSPDSMSWSGKNVFDVYSLSMDTALDGTRYSEW